MSEVSQLESGEQRYIKATSNKKHSYVKTVNNNHKSLFTFYLKQTEPQTEQLQLNQSRENCKH